ncbi:MAG TPA: hypothetical protein VEU08_01230, partial [Vicinamibacterales bacterium]|nr:hypothetical protein [Vicinamibacterales bacterium]
MSTRHLPVRPDLIQLKHQAKDLLREMKRGNPRAKLADAQFALARSYGVVSWPRLVVACHVVDAIWEDDAERLRAIVTKRPALLHEMALAREGSNWGPPMSYAANLGRDRIIRMLWELGARDLAHAAGRAALQGKIDTARMIHELAGRPPQPVDAVMGPCETLNAEGLAYVLEMGAPIADRNGDWRAPVAMILETYCRKPDGKHRCLELLAGRGIALPDTPPM